MFHSNQNASATPFSTAGALDYYIKSAGVPPSKMVLGMPLYGRAFQNTQGPGTSYNGVGEGSWEQGVWDYKALPRPGGRDQVDPEIGASWCYDGNTMVSYDNVQVGEIKANFIRNNGLGGGMWWESSGDKGGSAAAKADGSLIGTFVDTIGGVGALDQSPNNLDFPESKFDNIRTGMQGA